MLDITFPNLDQCFGTIHNSLWLDWGEVGLWASFASLSVPLTLLRPTAGVIDKSAAQSITLLLFYRLSFVPGSRSESARASSERP